MPTAAVTPTAFAVIAVVVIAGSLVLAVVVQRRDPGSSLEAAQQVRDMTRVGRVVFGLFGVAAIVVGIAVSAPVAILGGVASLVAAVGQHWAYGKYRS